MLPKQSASRAVAATLFLCIASNVAAIAPPPAQQDALRTLFASTSGPSWRASDGWSATESIDCDAHGLTCDIDGNVLEIFLVDNGLDGPLPDNLSAITSLRGLVLNRNKLHGKVPGSWADFESLELISLRDNAIEEKFGEHLANVNSLKVIDLCHNYLSGTIPAAYLDMPTLGTLSLCHNDLQGRLPDPSNATSLYDLDLSDNTFIGRIPSGYFELPALWRMELADNAFTGELPENLQSPAPLVTLDLSDNLLTGGLESRLGPFVDLVELRMARNGFTGPLPDDFHAVSELQHLDLSGNAFHGNIPTSLLNHAALQGASNPLDPSVNLSWNAITPTDDNTAWLQGVGVDLDSLVQPVSDLSITDRPEGWVLKWQPITLPDGVSGHYRIETAQGRLLAETDALTASGFTVTGESNIAAEDFRVFSVVPAHDANPNAVESEPAHLGTDQLVRWTPPGDVAFPANFDRFEDRDWTRLPFGTTVSVSEVERPDLFSQQPEIDPAGGLHFEPAGSAGESTVTLDVRDALGSFTASFRVTLGPAANRQPTFTAGSDLTVLNTGTMQVHEWASAVDDGDGGTQAMRFDVETDQPDWFAFDPDLSVPSGTLRFRTNPGQTGTITLRIRLIDDGGTENGGVDSSAEHTFRITLTDDQSQVTSAGLASDAQTPNSGGGALGLLSLALAWRRRSCLQTWPMTRQQACSTPVQ